MCICIFNFNFSEWLFENKDSHMPSYVHLSFYKQESSTNTLQSHKELIKRDYFFSSQIMIGIIIF